MGKYPTNWYILSMIFTKPIKFFSTQPIQEKCFWYFYADKKQRMALGKKCIGDTQEEYKLSRLQPTTKRKKSSMYSGVKVFLLLAAFSFGSCSVTKSVRKKTPTPLLPPKSSKQKIVPKVEAEKTLPKRPLTTDEKVHNFLTLFGPIAQREMREYKIPASITLAQGLLESGFGEGRLAVEANNHLGSNATVVGKVVEFTMTMTKRKCFRVYADAGTSYRDHSFS